MSGAPGMLVSFTLTSLISLAQVSQGRAWRGASVHVVGQGEARVVHQGQLACSCVPRSTPAP